MRPARQPSDSERQRPTTLAVVLLALASVSLPRWIALGFEMPAELEISLLLVAVGGLVLLVLDFARGDAAPASSPPEPFQLALPPERASAAKREAAPRAPSAASSRAPDFLESVLEHVDVGILACDASGALTVCNREARELCGIPGASAAAPLEQYCELYESDGTTPISAGDLPLARALRGETIRGTELMIASRAGFARTVLATARPLSRDGRAMGALMAIADVTERNRTEHELRVALEKAVESDRLKSSFLANMSHEIRTPLNIILGYNQMIADYFEEQNDSSQVPLLDAISRASRRLMNTVHGILDISRIEVGAFEIQPVALKPASLIERILDDYRVTATDKNLTLRAQIEEPDATILCDEHCFTQAVGNLLDNAIKFTESGGVAARLYRDDEGVLCVEIQDSGVGIDSQYLPDLFKPFSQEDSGYTRRFEGSGLGLALVKSYLQFNDAQVTVESEKGRGSVFRIRFFKEVGKRKTAQEGVAVESSQDRTKPKAEKPTVLVVEDDVETQGYMKALLAKRYHVLVAASGDEFRKRLTEAGESIRVILMDLSLKGDEDGIVLTRSLREHPHWKNIAVIATTAHAFLEDQNRALAAGCDAFLAKPFGREELFSTMERLIA